MIKVPWTIKTQFCWSTGKIPLERVTSNQGSQESNHLSLIIIIIIIIIVINIIIIIITKKVQRK